MLDLGQFAQRVQMESSATAHALRILENAVNRLARNLGASPTGDSSAPPDIGQVNVVHSGEIAHLTITDSQPITKHVNYFAEVATEPNFLQPHVIHMGVSRGALLNLPTNDSSGAQQTYYVRAYSQYLGSKPSRPVVFGAPGVPTGISMSGTTNLTLQPSTGSGTATSDGQQGHYGFGRFLSRPAVSAKRSVKT
jgi:hypothetical protein